jgi:hypothetical protein
MSIAYDPNAEYYRVSIANGNKRYLHTGESLFKFSNGQFSVLETEDGISLGDPSVEMLLVVDSLGVRQRPDTLRSLEVEKLTEETLRAYHSMFSMSRTQQLAEDQRPVDRIQRTRFVSILEKLKRHEN